VQIAGIAGPQSNRFQVRRALGWGLKHRVGPGATTHPRGPSPARPSLLGWASLLGGLFVGVGRRAARRDSGHRVGARRDRSCGNVSHPWVDRDLIVVESGRRARREISRPLGRLL